MLIISQEQYKRLEQDAMDRQAREIGRRFASEIQAIDPQLAGQVLAYVNSTNIEFLDRLLSLTTIEQHQQFLLFLFVQTGVDIFNEPEFGYILEHPLLSGNAKARHIALSAYSISARGT